MELLDPKTHIDFPKFNKQRYEIHNEQHHSAGIWELHKFLTESECNEILSCSQKAWAWSSADQFDRTYRDSRRLLAFDSSGNLIKLLES